MKEEIPSLVTTWIEAGNNLLEVGDKEMVLKRYKASWERKKSDLFFFLF